MLAIVSVKHEGVRKWEPHSGDTVAAMERTGVALAATDFEVRCTGDDCYEGSNGEKASETGEHFVDRMDVVRSRGIECW